MLRKFKVKEAYSGDALKGIARLHPVDMAELNLTENSLCTVNGKKITPVRIRTGDNETDRGIIQIDGLIRENAGTSLDENVTLETEITHHFAGSASIQPMGDVKLSNRENDSGYILSLLEGQCVTAGDRIRLNLFGTRVCDFLVTATTPEGIVILNKSTYLNILKPVEIKPVHKISYEYI